MFWRKIRVFQILKTEQEYETILEGRLDRFNQWESLARGSKHKNEFRQCVRQTIQCHRRAESLKSLRDRLYDSFPADYDAAIDRVISLQARELAANKEYQETLKYQEGRLVRDKEIEFRGFVKQLLLDILTRSIAISNNTLVSDYVKSKTQEFEPQDQTIIETSFAFLYKRFDQYMTTLEVCCVMIELSDLYRGLLYGGIVNIAGSELDRRNFGDHIKSIGLEAIGVTDAGIFLAIFNSIKELMDLAQEIGGEKLPELIESAIRVEQYISKYQLALEEWKRGVQILYTSLDQWRILAQKYK